MAFRNRLGMLPLEYLVEGTTQAGRFALGDDAELYTEATSGDHYLSISDGMLRIRETSDDDVVVEIGPNSPAYISAGSWVPLIPAAPFSNFNGTLGYKRHADGTVALRGNLTSGGAAVANGTTVCTLPAGHRPPFESWHGTVTSTSGQAGNLVIEPGGAVRIWDFGGAPRAIFPLAINARFDLGT